MALAVVQPPTEHWYTPPHLFTTCIQDLVEPNHNLNPLHLHHPRPQGVEKDHHALVETVTKKDKV